MKALYHVILTRPAGHTTWRPMQISRPGGNYFTSKAKAQALIDAYKADEYMSLLPGPGRLVLAQFAIGTVILEP